MSLKYTSESTALLYSYYCMDCLYVNILFCDKSFYTPTVSNLSYYFKLNALLDKKAVINVTKQNTITYIPYMVRYKLMV